MFARLFLLFTIVPLAELALLLWIGEHTSWMFPLLLVVVAGVLGAWLARQQGWRTLQRIQADLAAGRMPTDSLMDGLIVFAAAVLLITPGVLSDVAALILLFPPSRALVKRLLAWRLQSQLRTSFYNRGPSGYSQHRTYAHDEIIDARVVESPAADSHRRP